MPSEEVEAVDVECSSSASILSSLGFRRRVLRGFRRGLTRSQEEDDPRVGTGAWSSSMKSEREDEEWEDVGELEESVEAGEELEGCCSSSDTRLTVWRGDASLRWIRTMVR